MKPLTREELKALPDGEYFWLVELNGMYVRKVAHTEESMLIDALPVFDEIKFADYGTKWLAYKNKEQAEAKGEIVNVPCNIGDTVYFVEHYKPKIIEAKVSMIQQKADKSWVIRYTYYSNVYQQNCTHNCKDSDVGTKLFTDKAEAEKRLTELKGEPQE